MNEQDLDLLFAQARRSHPADEAAAERFLTRRRQQRATAAARHVTWPLWLAAAALGAGIVVTRLPAQPLPAAAAYQVYEDTLGAGW